MMENRIATRVYEAKIEERNNRRRPRRVWIQQVIKEEAEKRGIRWDGARDLVTRQSVVGLEIDTRSLYLPPHLNLPPAYGGPAPIHQATLQTVVMSILLAN